jgi:hypothetical protein
MSDLVDIDKITSSVDVDTVVKEVMKSGNFNPTKEIQNVLPYTRRVSANDIVPEEYQQKLMAIDYTMSQCFWLIGDVCVDLIESVNRQKSKELGKVISKQDIFEAVGLFCHRTGRSTRYYYECARFFSPETRQRYDVPFNVFAEARWVKEWEVLLKIASENPMWGAERVRSEYYKKIGEEPPTKKITDGGAEMPKEELPLPEEGEQWDAQPRFKAVILSKLDHTIDDLRSVLERLPLPTDIRIRIGDMILEVQDIELQIRREA